MCSFYIFLILFFHKLSVFIKIPVTFDDAAQHCFYDYFTQLENIWMFGKTIDFSLDAENWQSLRMNEKQIKFWVVYSQDQF